MLHTLDEEQRQAVVSTEPNILVIAGAGSGKTRVLTERIKYLLNTEVEPHNIVAITFTNMAAEEMKLRLADVPGIGDAFVGTLHAFASRIYTSSGEEFSILNGETEKLIVEELLYKKKYQALTMDRWLRYMDLKTLVDRGKKSEEELGQFLLPSEHAVMTSWGGDYQAIMDRDKIISFDQLLEYATKFYNSLNAEIEYVLVDELQDIGSLEYKFITGLNAKNTFFVGDDWQAIYGWKGGDVEIFRTLEKDDKYYKFYLENNYRNSKKIMDMGLRIISQVDDKINKEVRVTNRSQGQITINNRAQQSKIVDLLLADKDNWKEWFVLVRSNKEAYELQDLLDKSKISYAFFRKSEMSLEELIELMGAPVVKMLTVHSAKGLENKKVILYGNFPLVLPSYRRNDAERKVMYVGVTRAIEELHIFN